MAPRADLTGQMVGGWTVLQQAPAQNRVPFWACTHDACCIVTDIPHVTLTKALAGKGTLPACTTCVPAEERRNIDHGLHLACGTAHLVGTPCPDGSLMLYGTYEVAAEPVAIEPVRTETVHHADGATVTHSFDWSAFTSRDAEDYQTPYTGHPLDVSPPPAPKENDACSASSTAGASGPSPSWAPPATSDRPAPAPAATGASLATAEPEPAAQLADADTGAVVLHGVVDRLEEPQAILDVIRAGMHGRARNHQSQPGPSQIGGCERRLGHHIAFGQGNGARDDGAWRPEVGTAVHAWLDAMFSAPRWLSDVAVTAPVAGRLDLFDTETSTVIDFKVSGKPTRDKAARGQVSVKYETQLDLYGLGMIVAGFKVERVALLFLPAAGSLSESVWYSRPFNIQRALEAVARRDRIAAMLSMTDDPGRVLSVLPTTEDFCSSCPALGAHCKGAETAWIPGGLPDSTWPAYDAAVKAAS